MRTFLLILLGVISASAAPFLTCDPYPIQTEAGLNVGQFVISGLAATNLTVPATINPDGTQFLHYDLALSVLTNGTKYSISVVAVNGYGGISDPSTLLFTKGVPAPPSSLRISPI